MITGIRPAGRLGLLLELETLDDVLAVHQHLKTHPMPGQVDAVAAARTIMLTFGHRDHVRAAHQHTDALTDLEFSTGGRELKKLQVVYDGEDLAELAETLGMSTEAFIQWHSGQQWVGAFGGFAPGFTYCTPAESTQPIPRRSSPRTAVPERSVAVAGDFSAVYPRVSPGGWQLIGRTSADMWDLDRADPALVSPGDTVVYVPVSAEKLTLSAESENHPAPQQDAATSNDSANPPDSSLTPPLTVEDPGMQLLIQDLGRPGYSDLGVSRAGVADEAAARQANRLVGNSEGAPVLESLMGGVVLNAARTAVLAVTGAVVELTIAADDEHTRHARMCEPFALTAGEQLRIGPTTRGLRAIVGLRGGVAGQPELGSLSSDTMSGLGPAPLQIGDSITADDTSACAAVGVAEPTTLISAGEDGSFTLRFTYGPREDWFAMAEQRRLTIQLWQVTQESNRVGLRLEPVDSPGTAARPLQRTRTEELPSEGVARGSLQMPPSGNPVLFLNDHPVTGGYPVIGVLLPEDLPAAAQLRPGDIVRLLEDPDPFTPCDSEVPS
ncbi:carboxyltransferase domain-containing protein [Nesterenkonia natronophila]|uniref:Carboxyltransferase domain-containing protein n=1 Tax=Nesterenkonia natronophila TaxID=2174932 RepID=A0A3A4F4E2_9MICC|nr:carboxyltransferase domain-containing protein [Nesterenkonia natronophila]RJN32943.1 carboxyltransferase domain-containing protein [Nesterenkonia natronophila]